MKRLKQKTVMRAFEKLGFYTDPENGTVFLYNWNPQQHLIGESIFEDNLSIKFKSARWTKKANVHIESYWSYPRNLKELDKIIAGLRETYSELCGIEF